MTTFSDSQQRALQKSLAFAQYIYALGDNGIMAMNPNLIRESFEKMWNENSMQSHAVRDAAKWMVECMSRDPQVAAAFTAPIDEAEKN